METPNNRKIIFEDGLEIYGSAFGASTEAVLEIVFNTSMTGYQEILSDPSYTGQAVVMTYPLIGNYGIAEDDYETESPTIGALIVREYNDEPSNYRSVTSLGEVMKKHNIPGISGVDTRKLTRSIRDKGSRKVLITDASTTIDYGLKLLRSEMIPKDLVRKVSCKKAWESPSDNERYHVTAIDCGIKRNIVRCFNSAGCSVTVVPWNTTAETIPEIIETIKGIRAKIPIFGICLGHQLVSLAFGAETYKLKFGHRGGNHPVKDLVTEKTVMTSQNHSYAVDRESIRRTPLEVTHINLLDGTVEGVSCERDLVFSVQYHPESAPGPHDSKYLFERFIGLMERKTNA